MTTAADDAAPVNRKTSSFSQHLVYDGKLVHAMEGLFAQLPAALDAAATAPASSSLVGKAAATSCKRAASICARGEAALSAGMQSPAITVGSESTWPFASVSIRA